MEMKKVTAGHYKAEIGTHTLEAKLDTEPKPGKRGKDIASYTWWAMVDGVSLEGELARHESLKTAKAALEPKATEFEAEVAKSAKPKDGDVIHETTVEEFKKELQDA